MDPRTKLLIAIAFSAIAVVEERLVALAILALLPLVATLKLGLAKAWFRSLRLLIPMVLVASLITLAAFGLKVALVVSIRLLALTSAFFIFFRTTLPEDLAGALVKMGVPYVFAFILTTAMEFIPVIQRKVMGIMDAQRSRGIPLEFGWRALRHYPALFIPVMVSSFSLADELAMAMESKGFGKKGRSFYKDYKLTWKDWAALSLTAFSLLLWAFCP
jgi:energy-coupling factor transport system permease protein